MTLVGDELEPLRRHFVTAYGIEPAGVWSAPGRVNLIGEHTDYNGGLALPVALTQRTYAAARPRDDDLLRLRSLRHDGEPALEAEVRLEHVDGQHPGGWAAYVAGVPWALREGGHRVAGMDVLVDGRVPLGAGLASSAALECAVGAATSDLFGLGLLADQDGRAALALACVRAENDIAGAPTGGMDQSAALLCRSRQALLLDCSTGEVEHVPIDLDAHGLALIVTDTRATHALTDGQYGRRRAACEAAARALAVGSLREIPVDGLGEALSRLDADLRPRVRHVVTEIERVRECVAALRVGDMAVVGRLFSASHVSLRDDYEVSCPELDTVVETALAEGALGARMTGGGFGGSAIALVTAVRSEAVASAIRDAFTERGFGPPAPIACMPGDGARRDR